VVLNRYMLLGKLAFHWVILANTSIAVVTPNYLYMEVPFVIRPGQVPMRVGQAIDAGTEVDAYVAPFSANKIYIAKSPLSTWAGSVNGTRLAFTTFYELV
jgi:hypothetical protein